MMRDSAVTRSRRFAGMEDTEKAKRYDSLHQGQAKFGKNNAGAKELAGQYTRGKRAVETVSVVLSMLLNAVAVYFMATNFQLAYWWRACGATVVGALVADFLSGIVHWAADSYGTVEVPVLGKAFIRPFREHHIDPLAITRHDYIETNGDNCLTTLPALAVGCYIFLVYRSTHITDYYIFYCFLLSLGLFITFTNQIHKWSHTYSNLHPVVEFLQRTHLILPKRHHRTHHVAPHETYFCITTGWCNYPLEYCRFFSRIEWLIEKTFGVKPRVDDLCWLNKR